MFCGIGILNMKTRCPKAKPQVGEIEK